MKKVEIVKNGYEIIVNNVACKVIKQESKGLNKEVVDIEKAVGPEYQRYVSLSKLVDGSQIVELKPRKIVESKQYSLTQDEQTQIDELQAQIDAIIEAAKARYVAPSKVNLNNINNLTNEQKLALIAQLEAQLKSNK